MVQKILRKPMLFTMLTATVLAWSFLTAGTSMAAGDSAQFVVTTCTENFKPIPGTQVRILPRNPVAGTASLAEGISDEKGEVAFTAAAGKAIPLAIVNRAKGIRIISTHKDFENGVMEIWPDELPYVTQRDVKMKKKLAPIAEYELKTVVVDRFLQTNKNFTVTDQSVTFRINKHDGKPFSYTINLVEPPPKKIRNDEVVAVRVTGTIENPDFGQQLQICWRSSPDETPVCSSGGDAFMGVQPLDKKSIKPGFDVVLKAKVPREIEGNTPSLVFRVWTIHEESSFYEWMSWMYGLPAAVK